MDYDIVFNLDASFTAPMGEDTLPTIISRLGWPVGAICATQEMDGGIMYWSCSRAVIEHARLVAPDKELISELGIGCQVSFAYEDHPVLARDWNTAIVIYPDYLENKDYERQ